LSILSAQNDNLTSAQKALLLDHQRLGHINVEHLRTLYRCTTENPSIIDKDCRSCLVPKHPQVQNCTIPVCLACRVSKARKRSRNSEKRITVIDSQKQTLAHKILKPGQKIFVDQYESSAKGRLPTSKGQESPLDMYCGGTLFYDAASQLIQIVHQVSLGGTDMINAKQQFEREAMQCGVTVEAYHTDNGIFTRQQFRDLLLDANQGHQVSGVGAHHQNGLAERAIKTIQDMT